MQLQSGFDDDVDMPAGEQGVVVTIATEQHFFMCRLCRELHKMIAIMLRKILWPRRCQRCLIQRGACSCRDGISVQCRRIARSADPALAIDALVNDTKDRPAVFEQRNQCAEYRPSRHEAYGSVDRIDNPASARTAGFFAIFLPDDRVAGAFGIQNAADGAFGGAGGSASTGYGGAGDGGSWGSANGDDGYVTGSSSASADAGIDTSAFNQHIVMGANLQQNAIDMTVVGGSLTSTVVGEDGDDGV